MAKMKKNNDVLDTQAAADYFGAHIETVRRLARKGEIPSFKVGKDWRFRKEALTKWAETHHLRCKPPVILVIDDDAGIRKLAKRYLEGDAYQVSLASDGAEGLSYLKTKPVNLVLLDLKMPRMNGSEFLREFRKNVREIPVIVITGYADSELLIEAMKYGPFTLLAKPIDKIQLAQAVRAALI